MPGTGIALPAMVAALTDIASPAGGSLALPLALVRVIEAASGTVQTDADVTEICVSGGRATGVKLADVRGSKPINSSPV